jgi:putative endonuclease
MYKDRTMKQGFVYILFNQKNGTLYVGVTSDLIRRIWQHKNKTADSFTKKYGCNKLGYYEVYDDIINAIAREKLIKGGSRKKKIELIESMNHEWTDLYETIV